MLTRRWLLLGAGLALGGAGLWWAGGRPRGFALGPPRLLPSLLRTTLGGEDRLLLLTRRAEREIPGPLALSAPAESERIELRGFDATSLRPLFTSPLVSMDRGQNPDAAILGEQAGTVWLHIGGIGAASAVDGRPLADAPGLERINPVLHGRLPAIRSAYRMEQQGLVVSAPDGTRWRVDARRFTASAATAAGASAEPPPPPVQLPAPFAPPPFRAAQVRFGERWLGLVPARSTEADVASLRPAALRAEISMRRGEALRLWRGEVRTGSLAPPGWPEKLPDRWGRRRTAPRRLGGGDRAGRRRRRRSARRRLPDAAGRPGAAAARRPPGALLLSRHEAGAPLRLARLDGAGQVLWQAALPLAEILAVLPGARTLLIAGRARAGSGGDPGGVDPGGAVVAAIELGRGAIGGAYDLAAEAAIAV